MTEELKTLIDFAEGRLSSDDFKEEINTNTKLQQLLSDETIHWQGTYLQTSNPFFYIMAQNYANAAGRLNAHGAIVLFLEKRNIKIKPTVKYAGQFDMLLATSPKYLDIDSSFFEKHLAPKEESLSKADQKQIIKEKIKELFKYQTKPPKWIQNPAWPIKNEQPLFFVGQLDLKDAALFHDNGSIYIFMNPKTEEIETIKQFY